MAVRMRSEGIDSFTIYEKAHNVGGTWRENTYPGVACDVPSHLYSFSFAPNSRWTRRYSTGAEIREYLENCAEKFDLYRSIRFGTTVTSLRHNGKRWEVRLGNGEVEEADYVVSGLGGLHVPNLPDFEGREEFPGPVFHTARWRDDVDLDGRRVAVVGTAASAVQVIPEIVGRVAHLDVYQRTPNWVLPRYGYSYPAWIRSAFAGMPRLARAYRGHYFSWLDFRFRTFHAKDNWMKRLVTGLAKRHLRAQVGDDCLRAKLTPDYPLGCKRVLLSDDYFPALGESHVELVTEPIEGMTRKGLWTRDGAERPADVIVLATGFKPFDIRQSVEVVGPYGNSLEDRWENGITAYKTVAVDGFPNLFFLLGPNSGLGHTSVLLTIEAQIEYVIDLVKTAISRRIDLVQPKPEATARFDRQIQAAIGNRVWASGCGSWYVDDSGRNHTLYPHDARTFLEELKRPDLDDFLLEKHS